MAARMLIGQIQHPSDLPSLKLRLMSILEDHQLTRAEVRSCIAANNVGAFSEFVESSANINKNNASCLEKPNLELYTP